MEPVFPNALACCNFRIDGIHVSLLFQRHMETRIKEGNIPHTVQLFQTGSHNQQRRIIVSTVTPRSMGGRDTMEPSHLIHRDDGVHRL